MKIEMGSYETVFDILSDSTEVTLHPTDVLVVPVFQTKGDTPGTKNAGKKSKKSDDSEENTKALDWTPLHRTLDKAMAGYLKATLDDEKFKGDCGKKRIFRLRKTDDLKARWLVIVGLGPQDKLKMKKAMEAFCTSLKGTFGFDKTHNATIVLPKATTRVSVLQFAQAAVFGALQSTYKTQEAGEKKIHTLKTVHLLPPKGQTLSQADVEAARITGLAESFTKDLANKPANLKRAETLAEAARSLESLPGVSVDISTDLKKLQKEMPAFWAVAQGAAKVDPPRFIQVRYRPGGAGKIKRKIALVGKGVIFDTGGVQVKTGNGMNDMKFDMTGAATVLAAVKAAAEMKLKGVEVTAYVAATRNLIGEEAYLPDSIIESASGKRIEIRHTDAEGRVTLADAVYKATQDKPDEIITIATLTGAAGIAVGHCIALMGTDDTLLDRLDKTGKSVGETVQKLELLDEDFDNIKSDRDAADLSNTGKGRNRGHMTAGAFVISFAGDIPVAHLDIAGGDAKDGNATGIAVKGIIEYLRNEAK